MSSRREFLGTLAYPTAAAVAGQALLPSILSGEGREIARELAAHPGTPQEVAADEDFWAEVQRAFTVDRSLINLNNGGVSPSPAWVQEAHKRQLDLSNRAPTYYMWQIQEPQREGVRQRMAREWGVDAEEVAFVRNASEGLQTCQFGLDLNSGDEVLTTTQDYPRMITTFRQRERREGIVLKQVRIPVPSENPAEVVRRFEEAITPRTRMILCCHVINLTGQIFPVRALGELGRRHGIPVIVDGAHALAHFDFQLSDLGVDYYATSLHKWLFAPHGTGLLFVKRDRIPGLWPLMAAPERMDNDIRKYEEIGTHPAAPYLAIGEALTFHQGMGSRRKEARLRHLRDYWATALLEHDRFLMNTSLDPAFSCGIGNVQLEGVDTSALNNWLWQRHKIISVAIKHPEFEGLRVTASVYTSKEELDRFVDAMVYAARYGIAS
ncbi:MAG: aminotransferase class V-fold PLP-dependent enzyme [Longimicrobiales bacterium]